MAYRNTIDDTIEHILDTCDNDDFDFFLNQMSWIDFSENDLSIINTSKLFDRPNSGTIKPLKNVDNQLKVLDMIVSDGLNLNSRQKNGSFAYGLQLMRSSTPKLIRYALDHGFKFNQYSENPVWHSLELLQLNYLSPNAEKSELLEIISEQLKKGVDLDKSDPGDFFMKLNSRATSAGWNKLIELYNKDTYMNNYFEKHLDLIIKKEYFNIIPKDAIDIFVF